MTFEQFIHAQLFERGMFERDVKAVIERVKAAPENEPMAQRWNDDVSGYPPQMQGVAWLTAKTHALEYIVQNCPKAWFRSFFETETRA